VVTAPSPFVRLLRLPLHHTAIGSAPATGRNTQQQQQQQQQQQAGASSKAHQSISLLMLSSAALQLLQPCELQAAMAAALASLALEGEGCQACLGQGCCTSIAEAPSNAQYRDHAELADPAIPQAHQHMMPAVAPS
jgi:hypothetical protein